ncbi:uncharacterized protein VP01_4576g2 [Puccinia sorghi]|uniref:Uncharacterized protein n=1 Tax=Puccinia sorghi TaxID=27349 RepID=A0A0L6UPH3_9BASI|nr:uncharacterized protein VP01_4576g2 [Puccinia sorghi]
MLLSSKECELKQTNHRHNVKRAYQTVSQGLPDLLEDLERDNHSPRDRNTDPKSVYFFLIWNHTPGPCDLQSPAMSPWDLRSIPMGPSSSFPSGHLENLLLKHSSCLADTANPHNSK